MIEHNVLSSNCVQRERKKKKRKKKVIAAMFQRVTLFYNTLQELGVFFINNMCVFFPFFFHLARVVFLRMQKKIGIGVCMYVHIYIYIVYI